jgi:hypothetical protein
MSMDSTQFTNDNIDIEALRARLRKLTDEELIREGKAGRYMCLPTDNFGNGILRTNSILGTGAGICEARYKWHRRQGQREQ